MSLRSGMIYLKYLIPKWAGFGVRIVVGIVIVGVGAAVVDQNSHAKADVFQACNGVSITNNGCPVYYNNYAPQLSQRPSSSQEYDSVRYPFWWDGAWHSSPTPSPSSSIAMTQNQPSYGEAQVIQPSIQPIYTNYCPYPSQQATYTPMQSTRPSSSQEYDSVHYPFWWDGAWHSSPTPKPLVSPN
jgi:hypothetical protein